METSMTLKDWRAQHERSQDWVARKVGVSQSTIDRIEKGQQNATINLVRDIVDLTGGAVTVDDLVLGRAA
jgi:DNA-binding XRE family transcriptional regulator